jgi:hypothetical protein
MVSTSLRRALRVQRRNARGRPARQCGQCRRFRLPRSVAAVTPAYLLSSAVMLALG